MNRKYILVDKKPVPEPDILKWARWYEDAERHVADTIVKKGLDTFRVSTVFLGIDHNFLGPPLPPLLFETMVFTDYRHHPSFDWTERYSTWEEAEKGHQLAVKALENMKTNIFTFTRTALKMLGEKIISIFK